MLRATTCAPIVIVVAIATISLVRCNQLQLQMCFRSCTYVDDDEDNGDDDDDDGNGRDPSFGLAEPTFALHVAAELRQHD